MIKSGVTYLSFVSNLERKIKISFYKSKIILQRHIHWPLVTAAIYFEHGNINSKEKFIHLLIIQSSNLEIAITNKN